MTEGRRLLWRPRTPAITLILLAPFVGEVLNGATRLSFIFVFVPETLVWGCGALIIHDAVRRWHAGWRGIVLLGLALSVIVEVLVLQTSIAPLPWLQMASIPVYDRIWGVNWLWFAFMLGYEAVWIALVPILIVELIFPERRDDAWVGGRGLRIAGAIFVAGCLGLWALWTQSAVPVAFHLPTYWPPRSTLLLGVLGTVLLIAAAYVSRGASADARTPSNTPSPLTVGIATAAFAFPWWILIVLVFVPRPSIPVWLPLLAALIWALAAYVLIARWSGSSGWNDRHRWALAFSALVICMAMGYLGSSLWPAADLIAKIVLNAIAGPGCYGSVVSCGVFLQKYVDDPVTAALTAGRRRRARRRSRPEVVERPRPCGTAVTVRVPAIATANSSSSSEKPALSWRPPFRSW